jgi:hypothetical protein
LPPEGLPGLEAAWSSEGVLEFGDLEHYDVDVDGRLALHDRLDNALHLVATGGGGPWQVTSLGGRGAGPGELRGGNGVAFAGDGTVAVLDPPNLRVTVWHADGRYLYDLPAPGMHAEGLAGGAGRLLLKTRIGGVSEVGPGFDVQVVHWTSDAGRSVRQAMDPPAFVARDTLVLMASTVEWGAHARADTFTCGPCGMAARPGGGVLVMHSLVRNGYRASEVDLGGRVVASFGRDGLELPRHSTESWARQERMLANHRNVMASSFGLPPLDLPPVERSVLPLVPALAVPHPVGIDSWDRVWVLRGSERVDRSTFDLFDARRSFLGSVTLTDAGLTSIRVRGAWLAGRTEGPLGEAGVRLYRIVEPAPAPVAGRSARP